jgi:hypothetical protein
MMAFVIALCRLSLSDRADTDFGIVDVPAFRVVVDAPAGEFGHAPFKRGPDGHANCLDVGACRGGVLPPLAWRRDIMGIKGRTKSEH